MTPTPRLAPAPLPRGPFILLGAMTATTVIGPFVIGFVLRGGASPNWPPDRAIEWATVLGISGAVLVFMGACLSLALTTRRFIKAASGPVSESPLRPVPTEAQP